MLNTIVSGSDHSLAPLLIAHGLYGSARNWGVIAKRLSNDRTVLSVDMRNHGESDWFETHSYVDMASDLAEIINHFGGKADVVGHSMGGKASMVLALNHPDLVRKLIVADIAPVAYSHDQVQFIDAMKSLDLNGLTTRAEADRRLSEQVADAGIRSFLLQSLNLRSDPVRWRLNLDVLEREMEKIVGFPAVTGPVETSTLFLSGKDSDYVRTEHRPTIKGLFPKAKFARIPGAGHWLHADTPREFEAAVRAFLA